MTFADCSSLTSITIPANVTSIGDSAFEYCSNLTSITILNPDCYIYNSSSTISKCTIYGYKNSTAQAYAEKYGYSFEALDEAPDKAEDVLEYEKYDDHIEITGCDESAEGELVIPNVIEGLPVTSIGGGAFFLRENLESIIIPDSVTSIGATAFFSCRRLESIIIPKSVTSIGAGAFAGTAWLKNKQEEQALVIVNNILVDGMSFRGEAVIPDGVTSIADSAFSFDPWLISVTIPESVTSIVDGAFSYCSQLTSIVIPESVTYIDYEAFCYCTDLNSITILNPDCEIYDSQNTISNGVDDDWNEHFNGTIYGYENSTAQAYAEKYGYTFEPLGEAPNVVIGDANLDGKVTVADAVAILQYIGNKDKYNLSDQAKKNADCFDPGDGITPSDALAIQKLDARVIEKLPELSK